MTGTIYHVLNSIPVHIGVNDSVDTGIIRVVDGIPLRTIFLDMFDVSEIKPADSKVVGELSDIPT